MTRLHYLKSISQRQSWPECVLQLGSLPLVFSLMEVVSLNTMGARVLRSRAVMRDADDNAPVTWDSKIDIFDERKERVLRKAERGRSGVDVEEVQDVSLYEFWL